MKQGRIEGSVEGGNYVIRGPSGVRKQMPLDETDLHVRVVAFQDSERTAGRTIGYADALVAISKQDKLAA